MNLWLDAYRLYWHAEADAKLCAIMWFVTWVTAELEGELAGAGGPAGGAEWPPSRCAAGAASPPAATGRASPACCFLMFVFTCFVLMKGSLLITAFINISCSTKGRQTCTQTTGGEGSSWEGKTSKQGLWKLLQHDDTDVDFIQFILMGCKAVSNAS